MRRRKSDSLHFEIEQVSCIFLLTLLLHSEQNKRKVERPPLDILLKEVKELGYVGTGRKYGVSDNAIRQWLRIEEKKKLIFPGKVV